MYICTYMYVVSLEATICIHTGWIDATDHVGLESCLVLCKLMSRTSLGEDVYFSLRVRDDFSWTLFVLGKAVDPATCTLL